MARSRKYYSLLVRSNSVGLWTIQFGDYDRSVVAQEGDDTKDDWPKGTKMKIICTGDKQSDIEREVDRINNAIIARNNAGVTA